jgi:hypothetical protein
MRVLIRAIIFCSLACALVAPNATRSFAARIGSPITSGAAIQNLGVRVWVNTTSGIYHCPGTRYYGATKRGKYLSEQDATSQGYRGAAGRACGSPTLRSGPIASPQYLSGGQTQTTRSSTKVWVNTGSGVYHCPGTRYYGATKSGAYMAEAVARESSYRPAYGRSCA